MPKFNVLNWKQRTALAVDLLLGREVPKTLNHSLWTQLTSRPGTLGTTLSILMAPG
jgi:hypothetical protein